MSVESQFFAELKFHIDQKDYAKACELCPKIELMLSESQDKSKNVIETFYCEFMLCLFLTDNIDEARFLWLRVPAMLKSSPNSLLSNFWSIGKAIWQCRPIEIVYAAVATAKVDPFSIMITDLLALLQNQQVVLISNVFTSISIDLYCGRINISRERALEMANELEWEIDEKEGNVMPKPVVRGNISGNGISFIENFDIKKLTNYISHFESKPLKADLRK